MICDSDDEFSFVFSPLLCNSISKPSALEWPRSGIVLECPVDWNTVTNVHHSQQSTYELEYCASIGPITGITELVYFGKLDIYCNLVSKSYGPGPCYKPQMQTFMGNQFSRRTMMNGFLCSLQPQYCFLPATKAFINTDQENHSVANYQWDCPRSMIMYRSLSQMSKKVKNPTSHQVIRVTILPQYNPMLTGEINGNSAYDSTMIVYPPENPANKTDGSTVVDALYGLMDANATKTGMDYLFDLMIPNLQIEMKFTKVT